MPIRILEEELASQIAAGEVVERPASVVKELVENALDAGATEISIRILEAGHSLIEVLDNGVGIAAEELELALTRHATSKIHTTEDLFKINSMGFRGEALASIASISKIEILSNTIDQDEGAIIGVEGGNLSKQINSAGPIGTRVRVKHLFFNVPARKKFQKSERSERGLISNLVARFALIHPHVRFSYEVEGRNRLQTSGSGNRSEVLARIYSPEKAKKLIPLDAVFEDTRISGFVGPLDMSRSNRAEINFYVNNRWIRDAALTSAVIQAYRGMIMVGRFPFASIFIELPPDQIDVNVHPTKAEIRFINGAKLFRQVQQSVRKTLLAFAPVPEIEPGLRWYPAESVSSSSEPSEAQATLLSEEESADSRNEPQKELPRSQSQLLLLVGQVGQTYLVAEAPDGIYLVDQHAAHERILFEQFQRQKTEMNSQLLLDSKTIQFSAMESEILESQLETLNKLGFQIENFGPQQFILRAVPELLATTDPEAALRVVVEDFEEDETPLERQKEAKLIARICKRAAIKAGQKLSQEEQESLLIQLADCEAPRTCPHGRPTMIHLSVDILERQFGRRGAR